MNMNDIQEWSHQNWLKLPAEIRSKCIKHMQGWIADDILNTWRAEYANGNPIGGAGFHMFGGGMQIRNRLREVLKDDELPGVPYEGYISHNMDDVYLGAIIELLHAPQITTTKNITEIT